MLLYVTHCNSMTSIELCVGIAEVASLVGWDLKDILSLVVTTHKEVS